MARTKIAPTLTEYVTHGPGCCLAPAPSEEAPDDFEETFELDRHPLRAPSSEAGTRGPAPATSMDPETKP